MYTVLICLALAALFVLILAIGEFKDSGLSGDGLVMSIFGLIFAEMMAGFIGMLLALFLSLFAPKVNVKEEIKLVAFRDGVSVTGSFFLGCGSVDDKDVYLYYTQRSDGAIRKGRIENRSPLIYEENRTDGVLEKHHQVIDPNSRWRFWTFYDGDTTYIFRVPKGTVVRQFRADLGK